MSSTDLAPHVRLDEPEPVEHRPFEVAVVRLRAEHGHRRAPGLREVRAIERRRLVERPHPLGDERPTGADPEARRHPPARASCLRVMLTRATSAARARASGPVASAAHATASGRSRNEGRREIDSERGVELRDARRDAVEAERDERLRDGEPAGLEPPVAAQEPRTRATSDRLGALLERDQAHRRRLRVAAQVDVVDGGVAEVPAAVRALARSRRSPTASRRVAASSGVEGVHGEQHARGGLDERASIVGPAPGCPALRVGARSGAADRDARSRRRAPAGRPRVVERERGERGARGSVAIGRPPPRTRRPAAALPRASRGHAAIDRAPAPRRVGRLDLRLPLRRSREAHRRSREGARGRPPSAEMEARGAHRRIVPAVFVSDRPPTSRTGHAEGPASGQTFGWVRAPRGPTTIR